MASDSQSTRPSRRVKVQEVSDDAIASIRQRELAAFYGDPQKALVLRKDHSADDGNYDNFFPPARSRTFPSETRSRNRGSDSPPNGGGSSRGTQQRSSGRQGRRTQSEQPRGQQSQQNQQQSQQNQQQTQQGQPQSRKAQRQQQTQQQEKAICEQRKDFENQPRKPVISFNKDRLDGQTGGNLYYSLRVRKDGTFLERNFDSSPDGLIAAAAGAAIGAITVRRMQTPMLTEELNKEKAKERRWKTIGGAVVGAAALNCGENWFRVWTEENAERREAFQTAAELCGEGVENFM